MHLTACSAVQGAVRTRGITLGQPGELRQGVFGLTAWQAVYRGSQLWGLVVLARQVMQASFTPAPIRFPYDGQV
jgi:hypothetical protein